jgi:polar amino acid transport system substrate-binding protein
VKRYAAAAVATILTLSVLAGCGGSKPAPATPEPSTQSATPTIDKIKKDGKLVVGTSPDYPPFETLDNANNVIGFDMDIMGEVATKLGVKLEVVQIGFDGLIVALGAKKFDVMAAGVSVTDERKKSVDFSKPYLVGTDAIVVHKDNNDKITKLEDLKGKKVAVQIGTVQADAAKKIEGINVKEYNMFTEAAAAVSAKQADALYLHSAVAKAFVAADKNLKIVAETAAKDTAYALRKDTPDLTAVVNQTLDELQKSGKMDQLVQKWFK